jgi:O-antigen/teichoic acid export membrane protein
MVPLALPLAFGEAFRPAVIPSLIMVPGGVVVSAQVLLCRALAARGNPRPLLHSFAVSLVGMCLADTAVIPLFGIVGAAVVSTGAPLLGLWTVVARRHRRDARSISLLNLMPRGPDFRTVLVMAAHVTGLGKLRFVAVK